MIDFQVQTTMRQFKTIKNNWHEFTEKQMINISINLSISSIKNLLIVFITQKLNMIITIQRFG